MALANPLSPGTSFRRAAGCASMLALAFVCPDLLGAAPLVAPSVSWGNQWSKAHIIEKSVDPKNPQAGVQNKVHYEGSWNYFDEWLAPDKLRTSDGSPLPAPTPTANDLAVAERVNLTGTDFFAGTWSVGGIPIVGGATAGIKTQGVQQIHIGVYAQRPDAKGSSRHGFPGIAQPKHRHETL